MSRIRRLRPAFVVIVILLGLAGSAPREANAASCGGKSHTLMLSSGTASPGSGSTSTRFAFSVVYTDNDGCSPARIVVAIPGVGEFALTRLRGDLQTGATYGRTMTLPAGRWPYSFQASSGTGVGFRSVTLATVSPAQITVTTPTPKPTPTPGSTPRPAPTASPAATPTSTAGPRSSPRASLSAATPAVPGSPGPSESPASSVPDAAGPIGAMPGGDAPLVPNESQALPRPIAALIVSSVGTVGGIGLFALLGARLLRTPSQLDLDAGRKRGQPSDPGSSR